MIHQAVVGLLLRLATFFFFFLAHLDFGIQAEFAIHFADQLPRSQDQLLNLWKERYKQWFSCLVYDVRLRGWTACCITESF